MSNPDCVFCASDGGEVLWRDVDLRVIAPSEPDYPGFLRVVWNDHVREMTDLTDNQRAQLMRAVFCVESVLREVMSPDKINLASLGNVVPHMHWHVIPRFRDDAHFPNPIWGQRLRESVRGFPNELNERLRSALNRALAR